jgi:hypothetical protein
MLCQIEECTAGGCHHQLHLPKSGIYPPYIHIFLPSLGYIPLSFPLILLQQVLYRDGSGPRFCPPNGQSGCPRGYSCEEALNQPGVFVCCSVPAQPVCPAGFDVALDLRGGNPVGAAPIANVFGHSLMFPLCRFTAPPRISPCARPRQIAFRPRTGRTHSFAALAGNRGEEERRKGGRNAKWSIIFPIHSGAFAPSPVSTHFSSRMANRNSVQAPVPRAAKFVLWNNSKSFISL